MKRRASQSLSVVVLAHTKRQRAPSRPAGIDLTRYAEQLLYPGKLSRELTWAQQRRAVNFAKAQLVADGRWPETNPDRRDGQRAASDSRRALDARERRARGAA
jgi:hypothetical protein